MATIASSRFPDLYDPVRRCFVAATPEEKIRQKLLHRMLYDLEYPKGLLAIEISLGKLHSAPLGFLNAGFEGQSKAADSSKRRADIVCYRSQGDLIPLLIVECKAAKIAIEAQEQAFGYNAVFGAPFVCLAGSEEIATLWFDGKSIARVPFLPHYRELNDAAKLFS